MVSERLALILRKSTNLAADQIANLTEAEGWRIVYQGAEAKRKPRDDRPQICLTGFTLEERESLARFAADAGLKVVTGVTAKLAFLCIGAEPGPAKLVKAAEQGVTVLDESALRHLVATGEIQR